MQPRRCPTGPPEPVTVVQHHRGIHLRSVPPDLGMGTILSGWARTNQVAPEEQHVPLAGAEGGETHEGRKTEGPLCVSSGGVAL